MPHGPGKYDREATFVMRSTSASVVIVLVVDGDRGDGFSLRARNNVLPSTISASLRHIADQIDASESS